MSHKHTGSSFWVFFSVVEDMCCAVVSTFLVVIFSNNWSLVYSASACALIGALFKSRRLC